MLDMMSKTKYEIKKNLKKWIITFKKIVRVIFDKSKTKKDKIFN